VGFSLSPTTNFRRGKHKTEGDGRRGRWVKPKRGKGKLQKKEIKEEVKMNAAIHNVGRGRENVVSSV